MPLRQVIAYGRIFCAQKFEFTSMSTRGIFFWKFGEVFSRSIQILF